MVAPARFGGSLSSWPSVRGPTEQQADLFNMDAIL